MKPWADRQEGADQQGNNEGQNSSLRLDQKQLPPILPAISVIWDLKLSQPICGVKPVAYADAYLTVQNQKSLNVPCFSCSTMVRR